MKVYFLSLHVDVPSRGFWDYALLEDLLDFEKFECSSLPEGDFGIVVIPGRSHAKDIDQINQELSKLKSVLVFIMGDEENVFPRNQLSHPRMIVWIQNPPMDLEPQYRKLGCGYTPKIKEYTKLPEKKLDWCFAGQVTHGRRYACVTQLCRLDNGILNTSDHFTGDIKQEDYYEYLANAKVAPCPSGPVTVDTFRIYEALEFGCVPIADNLSPSKDWTGFWDGLMGGVPFPTISDYSTLPDHVRLMCEQYPRFNNRVQAWWMRYKSNIRRRVYADILELTGESIADDTTIVVPVSPIPSHPDTKILEETIRSIRFHHPKSEIIITFDGVRPEHEGRRADYEEHIRRVLWKSRWWGFVTPVIFDEWKHQIGMMRRIIDSIKTLLLMYVEQDAPLVTDCPIDWKFIKDSIVDGVSNVIRLYHEAIIPEEHQYLMLGTREKLIMTAQWSQRPHLARTSWYITMLGKHFSPSAKCFIEDRVYGKMLGDCMDRGIIGWNDWKVHIYNPGENMKRSYHTDGRGGSQKLDGDQIW